MTLERLRAKRARDMLALIEQQRALASEDLARRNPDRERVDLRACSARELEWLDPEIELREGSMVRTDTAPHSAYGVSSPFVPSLLVVIYTARYFLASRALASTGEARDVHIHYGALQAVELPYERGMAALELEPRRLPDVDPIDR